MNSEYLRSLPYPDYLKTSHWSELSSNVKRNAGYKCEQCGSSHSLNAHHNSYKNLGDPKNEIKDLVCLCESCHNKFHRPLARIDNKINVTDSIFWNLIDKLLGGIFSFVFDLIEKLLGNISRFALGLILIIILSGALSSLNSKQVNKTQVPFIKESQTEVASVNKNITPIANKTNANIISKKPKIPTKIVARRSE